MNNSTTNPSDLKFCIRCEINKPIAEFYRKHTTRDGLSPYCRVCQLAALEKSKQASRERKERSNIRPYEQLAIDKLNNEGVHATSGAYHKGMAWVDIVVFGCIKIETRACIPANGAYKWHIGASHSRQIRLHNNHFLLLVALEDQPRFFVFSPIHPVFYSRGKLKTGIVYNPDVNQRKVRNSLTSEMMQYHEDKWDWINELFDLMREQKNFDMPNTAFGN
jgi:hypothetical protein